MFFKHDKEYIDLSMELSDAADWQAGTLRTVFHHLDIVAFATESVSGLFAVGTIRGPVIVYGSPGVVCTLTLSDPPGVRAKSLHFTSSPFKLLCVDDHDRLHIFDISAPGRPKLQRVVNFPRPINCMTVSPSHAHAFVALSNGEIKTYDTLCLRMSPYTVPPNLWTLYEQKVEAAGMPALPTAGSDQIIDLAIHPRDLNLLFIAYGGGVILSDLKQRNTVRAYQLILPPGAPGGSGYNAPDILLPRRPAVTTLAVHPSGHVLAVGYADGSIAFWALEDEDRPLLVRTLDNDEDVGTMNVARLEAALPSGEPSSQHPHAITETREPIFKLAWSGFPNSSDPRGGDTIITVLGGLASNAPPGVTSFLLPPLNPPARPSPPESSKGKASVEPALYPEQRAAMQASLLPLDSYTYSAVGPVQDFLLFPRASPHFGGAWDPQAVLLLSNSDLDTTGTTRVVEAYEFPPPGFRPPAKSPTSPEVSSTKSADTDDPAASLQAELASTLQSMSLSAEPVLLGLPSAFWSVSGSVLCKIEREAYEQLIRDSESGVSLPIAGGKAWLDDAQGQMKLMKFQPRRILITHDPNLTLRFQDLSAQLLVSSLDAPLTDWFPKSLPACTIELSSLLYEPSLRLSTSPSTASLHASPGSSQSELGLVNPTEPERPQIHFLRLAPESLECVIVLKDGTVVVYKLDADPEESLTQLPDEELVSLTHIPTQRGLRYRPVCAIRSGRGEVTACAISDVGFLAVAYSSGALLVLDLRGPRVILRHTPPRAKDHRHSILSKTSSSEQHDPFTSLTWTICATASDPVTRIRLITTPVSGHTNIFSLSRGPSGDWEISDASATAEASARTVPGGSVVLDAKNGSRRRADRQGFATVLSSDQTAQQGEKGGVNDKKRGCIWVSAGAKGVKCVADIDGERISRAEWASKASAVLRVEIVEKNGGCALVAFTEHAEALVYSLPSLEHLGSLQLPQSSLAHLSTDSTGDYVTHVIDPTTGLARQTQYATLFAARRMAPYTPPLVDLAAGRGPVPAQPAPVSLEPPSVIGSVLGYLGRGVTSGAEIDALLAGPDRPAPPQSIYDVQGRPHPATHASKADGGGSSAKAAADSMSSGVSDLYNRLGSALSERGQMLGDLEESFNSLEQGSKGMLAQAQKLAAQQSAKKWFRI